MKARKSQEGRVSGEAKRTKRKGQVETRPGLLGETAHNKTTSRCNYFLAVGGGGASLVCAQAPSPKALAITTAIMITFKNFNLYRLLSQQVAPVCLDREQPGGNAFLNFFERVTTGRQTLLRVTGRARARGHCLFPLSASTKTQSSGQNSHNHDHFKKFQSISPPFAAGCSGLFRQGTTGNQRFSHLFWMCQGRRC